MRNLEYYESPEHIHENLGFCKPYSNDDDTMWLIQFDGEPDYLITPSATMIRGFGQLTSEAMEAFARQVNPDYERYSKYNDDYIAKDAMKERGCGVCPMRTMCEPMLEDMDE